jgi:hypothetical protein
MKIKNLVENYKISAEYKKTMRVAYILFKIFRTNKRINA